MHSAAQTFFSRQLESTLEGKAARAYLEDRGLDAQAIARFGIGYAPSGGDALLRVLRAKYPEKLLVLSGLVSTDASTITLRVTLHTVPSQRETLARALREETIADLARAGHLLDGPAP